MTPGLPHRLAGGLTPAEHYQAEAAKVGTRLDWVGAFIIIIASAFIVTLLWAGVL
jgi:hypothetical protein